MGKIRKPSYDVNTCCKNFDVDEDSLIAKIVECNILDRPSHFGTLVDWPKSLYLRKEIQRPSSNVQEDDVSLVKRNPFLIDTVLDCLFGFLSLGAIKNARFVCRQWNSTGEIYLRKRSAICFSPNGLQPNTFMELSKYSLLDLPFPAYRFSNPDEKTGWPTTTLENFFGSWGKNIKEITFDNIRVLVDEYTPLNSKFIYQYDEYDFTSSILKASNLSVLKIKCQERTSFRISLDQLVSLKTLYLETCTVVVDSENYTRPAPLNITLINTMVVRFGKRLKHYRFNDFFDFSAATNIICKDEYEYELEDKRNDFDMANLMFNLKQLRLVSVDVENWGKAKGNVDFLELEGWDCYIEKNQLSVKRLSIIQSETDLSVLSPTIEKLSLWGSFKYPCSKPLKLLNLRHLKFELSDDDNSTQLSNFQNCPNLREMEILGEANVMSTLHLDCIPTRVKKILIKSCFQFEFADSNYILELDTLILEVRVDEYDFWWCENVLENIRPKVLVVQFFENTIPGPDKEFLNNTVFANPHNIQTFVIGTLDPWYPKNETYEGVIPTFDSSDKYSGCYKIEHGISQAITRKEFKKWIKMDGMGEEEDPFLL